MDESRGHGRVLLAAVFLTIAGVLNVIWGIAAIGNSKFFTANAHYVFSSLHGWGWITLIIGIVELVGAASLFSGNMFGRMLGIVVGSIAAIDALLSISAAPFWSLAVFFLSLWIVFGLVAYDPAN